MQLFDLPTELAQLAFDHIVMSRWCKRAMRIRIVNRQFKAYVDDSIFRLGLLRNLSISTIQTIDRNLYDRFVHQASLSYICSYISYRVLRDHSTTSLLGRVRQAAKTLCENDGNTETEAIMACANFLIPLALENEVFDRLLEERETDGSDNSDDLKADIYVAAIYLSKKSYVERLIADGIKFCELPGRLGVCSTIFGDDLSAAAMRGNLDMIELLLSYTSEYHQTGVLSFSEQWGIIWGASRYGHEAAFDFALDKRTIIYSDISIEADIRMLKEIIRVIPIPKNFERAARIIGPFDGSWSTSWLQRSARRGHVQMVRYFLDKGVKPNHITLVLAIGAGNETIVRMLLDAGADPNLPGPMYTALGNAVWKGSESIVKLLLSHSVDINEGSPPPIAIAVLKENMEMFRLLRDNGARLDTPETGRNLLKSVKEKGLSSMVDVLDKRHPDEQPRTEADIESTVQYCRPRQSFGIEPLLTDEPLFSSQSPAVSPDPTTVAVAMPPSAPHRSHLSDGGTSSGDRQHPAANARPSIATATSRHDRTPNTPGRKESSGRERALQDPGLKDYRLGECIGKGAFGAVYKAFNWGTGEAVAVKQIKLVNLPKSELRMIEAEIDLLKNLHHDNIVKYIGFVKSADCLNIILEYCENGSLHSICKAYGKFPENLVGVYMTQVLQGLQYLHDQGVIHRDIKGANILTTKDGKVKLADFGVSTSTLAGPDKEAQVVGTPYWMAPEIIELSGATPASDIWSLGCTVIELLSGRPPYHHLQAMPALFAIVNDDHPPLPEGVSSAARDFLMQCFQKDPNLRVSARKLLKHNWIVGCRRSDAPVAKAPGNFNQAVEEVKQWNKALTSSDNNLRASAGSDSSVPPQHSQQNPRLVSHEHVKSNLPTPAKGLFTLAKPRPSAEDFRSPELADDDNWDNDFATAISPTALQLPHIKPHDHFGGLLSADRLKAFASIDNSRDIFSNWSLDLSGGELMTMKKVQPIHEEDPLEKTIRPNWNPAPKPERNNDLPRPHTSRGSPRKQSVSTNHRHHSRSKSNVSSKFELPPRPDVVYREQSVEDYSDLFDDNDGVLNQRLSLKKSDAPQLFHPSDLTSLPRSTQSPEAGSMRRKPTSRPSILPGRPFQRSKSSIEIQKFAENDEEDFSDIFGPSDNLTEKDESDKGSEDGNLMVVSRLSNNSWLGDDEDEDDPFASMDPGWDEMDLEANIARDRHARLAEKVEELVRSLKSTENEERLLELSGSLLEFLWESGEVKDLIISAHGLLPILEILEPCTVKSRQHMILQLLKVVNTIILDDVELQENLCFVGGIPIITKFAARQYSNEIRLEAAAFVRQMYQTSTLTLQMFVSAGGLNVLVEFLDEDYDSARDLVLIGVNGIWNVFELQGPTPKNDFCRIFSRSKILDPLALVLHRVLDEDVETDLTELIEGRIVNIFYLFSQAENYVKEVVADRQVLKSVLKDLRRMTPLHQITMLKFIKNLSMLSTTLDTLHSADAIDLLIELLSSSMKKGHPHFREISNQVLNTMFNLCRLSKDRQEYAAVNGIIPILLKIMKTDRPPKEFALPILCDMAHSGSKGRRYLWQNKGLDFYVSLLADQYWQVTALDAIFVWLQEETAKVEGHLANGKFTEAIVSCFHNPKINAFDPNLLEPLLKLLRLSPSLAASLANPEMYSGIAQRLLHKKAVVRLNLLRLVRNILETREQGSIIKLGERRLKSLLDAIRVLAEKDSAVLVRNLASDLIVSHIDGSADQPVSAMASASGSNHSRPSSRRIYTPPSLHSAPYLPQTPTHASRQSQSSAYIEVAASPKRTAASLAYERDAAVQRPRSKDENSGIPISSIPRRVSGDAQASTGSPIGNKNRISRTSGLYPRPSLSSLASSRSESESSNKENATGVSGRNARYSTRYSPPAAASGSGGRTPSFPVKQRRSRAPSDEKSKWSA